MTRAVITLIISAFLLASGCASYKPMPLDPDESWMRLESISLEELVLEPGEAPDSDVGSLRPFDYSDGLSADEAAGLAVVMNPELRAFRLEQGIAEGQLVGAGLFPNPEVDTEYLSSPDTWAAEVDVAFDLAQALLTRGPEKERARLRVEEVRWEIADREWQLVNEVKLAFVDSVYWDEALSLNQTQKKVAERTLASIRARQAGGAATELDVILAEFDVTEIELRGTRLAGARRQSLQRLNTLLGLPPNHDTRLQKSEKPLAYRSIIGDAKLLAENMRARRPDLLAGERTYQVAEKELQLAYRKQFPRVHIGPSFETEEGEDSFGIGFSIEIPIFDRNQGEIAARLAERDQKRRLYIAALHRARAEIYAAWAEWEMLDAELGFYFSTVAPRLDDGLRLMEKVFQEGEIDLLQVLVFQGRALQSKREVLEQLRDFHRAGIEVEHAAGPTRPAAQYASSYPPK